MTELLTLVPPLPPPDPDAQVAADDASGATVAEPPADAGDGESGADPTRSVAWSITWKGKTWTEDDLTVAHLALISVGRQVDSWDINPTAGPLRLLYVLAAFIAIAAPMPIATAVAGLSQMSATEFLAVLDVS